MPEAPYAKFRKHPSQAPAGVEAVRAGSETGYAELCATSNFTFLTGASHPDELVVRAAELGCRAVAIADTNTLAGIVRAHSAAAKVGLQLVVAARVVLIDPPGLELCVYPTDVAAYGRLCTLLTLGKRRAVKGACILTLDDLEHALPGMQVVMAHEATRLAALQADLDRLRSWCDPDALSLAAWRSYDEDDTDRLATAAGLATRLGIPLLATNRPLYHARERRLLQDVVTCIRHGCTIEQAGFRLEANAERHLKPPEEMARLFADHPEAIARTVEVADRCKGFSLDQLRYQYPAEVVPQGRTAMQHLAELAWKGAERRLGAGRETKRQRDVETECDNGNVNAPFSAPSSLRLSVCPSLLNALQHELQLIDELGYAHYFLTVEDIVRYARSVGILCQGRGAAANSIVCYCLGVTEADPRRINLLFERFVSRERDEPPDIDIDFEHARREEVIQYIYRKYGRDRAALTAEVITYRGRLAVREVGKVLGLSLDMIDKLAKGVDWWGGGPIEDEALAKLKLNPADPAIARLIQLSVEIQGFPRHLSQHVGGFVLTQRPLSELVPIENAAMPDRTVIEWDKDDLDALGLLKVDVLGLGMLTALSKTFTLLKQHHRDTETQRRAIRNHRCTQIHTDEESDEESGSNLKHQICVHLCSSVVPTSLRETLQGPDDPATYDMICHADTVGVFQIESRAQMSMLPRLRPRAYYDLVIEVAIVRPGPIQGDMVHPYLRRRQGKEPVTFPDDTVEWILGKTLGVPLFQEQAMQLAIHCAGFTPDQADGLRRAVTGFRRLGSIESYGEKIIDGMLANGYDRGFAERCFKQIQGFSSYGFPESHAASFALLAYASAYLKRHHPAAFCAALLNSQPMGFYAPAQLVRDAEDHGVEVRRVDVNASRWECSLEQRDDPSDEATRFAATPEAVSRDAPPGTWGADGPAVRLGMNRVRGMREADAAKVAAAVAAEGPFTSVEALWRASGARAVAIRRLASADAFRSMGLDRQSAMWHARKLNDIPAPLFLHRDHEKRCQEPFSGRPVPLPTLPELEHVVHDYHAIGLSLRAHPMKFLRTWLDEQGAVGGSEIADPFRYPRGRRVAVGGVCLCRQRPGSAKQITFMTLEDETGTANLVVYPDVYRRFRPVARDATAMLVRGRIDRQGEVVHVIVDQMQPLDTRLRSLRSQSRNFR